MGTDFHCDKLTLLNIYIITDYKPRCWTAQHVIHVQEPSKFKTQCTGHLFTETGLTGCLLFVLLNNSVVQKHQNWTKIIYPCYWLFHFQFIPWKKKYFLLKNSDSSSEDEMIKLLDENGLLDVDLFPRNLAW